MILVTGAGGKTGRAVIAALIARGEKVRAVVRTRADFDAPQVEFVCADMQNAEQMQAAMQDVSGVYHICPNVHPREVEIGQAMIAGAQAAGVARVVFHSVLRPQTEKMPHHWRKLRVEELLQESGLNFTILQPTAYMQNILASREQITRSGVYAVPYPPESQLSLVDLLDVAEAAARVLTAPGHDYAIYELCGTPPHNQYEVAASLSAALGRTVTVQEILIADWRAAVEKSLDADHIDTLARMFAYYAAYGLRGNPNVLAWLLGRTPSSLTEFCAREIAVDRGWR